MDGFPAPLCLAAGLVRGPRRVMRVLGVSGHRRVHVLEAAGNFLERRGLLMRLLELSCWALELSWLLAVDTEEVIVRIWLITSDSRSTTEFVKLARSPSSSPRLTWVRL